jgi:hypothetical protein
MESMRKICHALLFPKAINAPVYTAQGYFTYQYDFSGECQGKFLQGRCRLSLKKGHISPLVKYDL